MNRLDIKPTRIQGVFRVDSRAMGDARGYLARSFCAQELAAAGWPGNVAQANITHTLRKGTVRGLHFQHPPHAEAKLVRCLRGKIWDVAVDLRADSPTFLQWHAEVLSPEHLNALLIPQGCAHGFQSLTDEVDMLYLHSAAHEPHSEGGLHANDPRLAIAWPLPIAELSARDQAFPLLTNDFKGIRLP